MNKAELRQFALRIQSEKVLCEAQRMQAVEAQNRTEVELSTVGLELDSIQSRMAEVSADYAAVSEANAALKEEGQTLRIEQYKLQLLWMAKQALASTLRSEMQMMQEMAAKEKGPVPMRKEPSQRVASDFLQEIIMGGGSFGDHSLQLELAAIHVPWQIIEDPLTSGDYYRDEWHGDGRGTRAFVYDRIWSLDEVGCTVQKPFNISVRFGSTEGKTLCSAGVGDRAFLPRKDAREFMTFGAEVLRGKVITFNFSSGVSSEFWLQGVEEVAYRRDVEVATAARPVLSLINDEEQGVNLDLVEWNDEVFLGLTRRAMEILGSGIEFGEAPVVHYELLGDDYVKSQWDEPAYIRFGDQGEEYENRLRYYSEDVLRVSRSGFSLTFEKQEDGTCDGFIPVYPDMLLFRVRDADGASRDEGTHQIAQSVSDDWSWSVCEDCVPFSQLEEFPLLETCSTGNAVEQFLCSELAMMDLLEEAVEAESVTEESIVFVRFVVQSNGSITDAQVLESVDPALDAAAVQAVGALPSLSVARKDGWAVPVEMCLPVRFTLN